MLYRFSWTTEFSVNKFILSHCNLSGSCLANANVRDENTNTKNRREIVNLGRAVLCSQWIKVW